MAVYHWFLASDVLEGRTGNHYLAVLPRSSLGSTQCSLTMQKTVVFLVIGIAALATILYLYVWNDRTTPTDLFTAEGTLIQNNPGFQSDTWYLSYETPGQPGRSVRLSFDRNSECAGEGLPAPCNESELVAGTRVYIEGKQRVNSVQVRTLTIVGQPLDGGRSVRLFFYNPSLDQGPGGVQCSTAGLVAVERIIPEQETLLPQIQDTINLLLRGEISEEETASGVESEFPLSGFSLQSAALNDGVLTLTFSDPENQTTGGSCRVGILWHQIEATARQFPEVTEVHFMPEELFQP